MNNNEWVDASASPQAFLEAANKGKKVFADFPGKVCLQHNGEQLLLTWPCHRFVGDYRSSVFPGLFRESHGNWTEVWAFYNNLKRLDGE